MNRNRLFKIILFSLIGVLIVIQLIPYRVPANVEDTKNDIIIDNIANVQVGEILKNSCYDCHSNKAVYPWYSYVAPVSWLIAHDVNEGRRELNFSEWSDYTLKRQLRKLEEIEEQVNEDEMPMPIYIALHSQARLNNEQKELLIQWAKALRNDLSKE